MKDQVTDKTASGEEESKDEENASRKEPIVRSQKADPFADAFEAAEKEIEGAPKAKRASKAEPDEDDDSGEGEEETANPKTPEKKPSRTQSDSKADEEEDDTAEDDKPPEKAEDDKAEKPARQEQQPDKPSTEPLKAKIWWSKDRREAFAYQPRNVQEAWLREAPVPHGHWTEEQKAAFAKLPDEAREVVLIQSQEIERGYGRKFQDLAAERKLAEGVRAAIPAEMRQIMEQRGIDEPGLIGRLVNLQLQSMRNPAQYIRDFIANNRIDPRQIYPQASGDMGEDEQKLPPDGSMHQQADVMSHPVMRQMAAQIQALQQSIEVERKEREEASNRQSSDEVGKILAETGEDGNSLFPFIRVLAEPMARILESAPEHFNSMGTRDRIVAAYTQALEAYPELIPPKPAMPQTPDPVDEPAEPEPVEEDMEQKERLKKAVTKKSKTPPTAPGKNSGDPFERAFSRAEKQVGYR